MTLSKKLTKASTVTAALLAIATTTGSEWVELASVAGMTLVACAYLLSQGRVDEEIERNK